jgi:malonyl-CoA/methylmalonyl-CoA synthetase
MLEDAALVVFTSGSTGEPKGVVHGHGAFAAKLDMIDSMLEFAESDTTLLVLQLTFIFAQWVALLTLLKGGTVVLHERFRAEPVAAALGQGVTRIALVPTMIRALRPLVDGGRCPAFSGAVMAGGEPLPAVLGTWLRSAWPQARLCDLYGTTETCACDFFVQADEYDAGVGSIGRPGPGIDFRIAEKDAELQIKSPFVMRGYLDQPELTRAAFADGYFRTGDQARIGTDGRVELVGRLKELVNRGGIKISPLEVERVFAQHPGIIAALAAGVPDPQTGESLVLAVVPRVGVVIDTTELMRWAAPRLDRVKLPSRIIVANELPTGRTGKADRSALREMAAHERE